MVMMNYAGSMPLKGPDLENGYHLIFKPGPPQELFNRRTVVLSYRSQLTRTASDHTSQ
jgi:hypothetical protein